MIQEVPKSAEKLYVIDSIVVPPSDLNKYRHLSVVNKLPDNIVLPSPPPLRHEEDVPKVDVPKVDESDKLVEEASLNHIEPIKDDFEMNADDMKDLVETKNFSIVQNVRKLLKKYRQRDQARNKQKQTSFQHGMSNEHNNDLSTPLRSLSPAHDFDTEMASAVDLTVNSKEIINEFIDNTYYDSDSEYDLIASPLAEILQLTELQPSLQNVDRDNDKNDTMEKQKQCDIPIGISDHDDKIKVKEYSGKIAHNHIPSSDKKKKQEVEREKEDKIEINEKEEEKTEIIGKAKEKTEVNEGEENTNIEPILEETKHNETDEEKTIKTKPEILNGETNIVDVTIDTLKKQCIKSFNTSEFRNYFKENVINALKHGKSEENDIKDEGKENEDEKENLPEEVVVTAEPEETTHMKDDNVGMSEIKCTQEPVEEAEKEEGEEELQTGEQVIASVLIENVPSLRYLALQAVRLNEYNMATNLKPLKIVFEFESQRKVAALNVNCDTCANKVPTLQELAREVANTIYSFNVKPLKEICKLALEKFNHLYLVSRLEASTVDIISEKVTQENCPESDKGLFYITFFNVKYFEIYVS